MLADLPYQNKTDIKVIIKRIPIPGWYQFLTKDLIPVLGSKVDTCLTLVQIRNDNYITK
jgi:hypothetical protein